MKVITFSLQTQQPLLATSLQGDPNSDVSYSYIPGSMIRGAIIGRYMKRNGLSELDLDNDEVKRLFFSANTTCYLNAYLQNQEGKRTLPVSCSLFKHKDDDLPNPETYKLMRVYERTQERELPEEIELKRIEQQFCTVKERLIVFHSISRRINIHNKRDRTKGRSTQIKLDPKTQQLKGEGEIFRYEAIDAGQTFQAVILCSNEAETTLLTELLQISQNLWLGGSQSAGYGHTKIDHVNSQENWDEVSIPPTKRIDRENLTITLLSDLILRDDWGQYGVIPPSAQDKIPVPLTKELGKILGININLQPQMSFANSTFIGGFNRKWGLPLPQVPAFAAGSVFVFNNISITSEQIQQLECQGIGERRIEGFGRVVVNWLEELEERKIFEARLPKSDSSHEPILKKETSRILAEQMAERLLQQKLEQTLQNQVGRLSIKGTISNSQLSRLQLVARQALNTGDCNLVISLLNNLHFNASGQFERAKISDTSLKQKLDEWLQNPGYWISDSQNLTVRVADVERSITDEFARENKLAEKYTLRLIMAVAKKAIKEHKQ
ncbi:RAMP superfamily CRISPR-associated protein [Anabaena sp. WFMT]|uniref:RAMP superfamily CRISPR-associated protein n=1 Tax=Anabaena sp. WFMT TaxID=3449730 RepID=UPI003F2070B3